MQNCITDPTRNSLPKQGGAFFCHYSRFCRVLWPRVNRNTPKPVDTQQKRKQPHFLACSPLSFSLLKIPIRSYFDFMGLVARLASCVISHSIMSLKRVYSPIESKIQLYAPKPNRKHNNRKPGPNRKNHVPRVISVLFQHKKRVFSHFTHQHSR